MEFLRKLLIVFNLLSLDLLFNAGLLKSRDIINSRGGMCINKACTIKYNISMLIYYPETISL